MQMTWNIQLAAGLAPGTCLQPLDCRGAYEGDVPYLRLPASCGGRDGTLKKRRSHHKPGDLEHWIQMFLQSS